MLVKGILTQMSGSIGGIVGSHNSSGMYLRARSIPVNPASAFQTAVRNAFSTLVNRYTQELSAAEREAWDTYGANTPVVNRVGDPINLSGQNWFIGANTPRLQAGLDVVDEAPTIYNRGEYDETITPSASAALNTLSIAFDDSQSWVDEDGSAILVYASRPQNPSLSFFAGPYRLAPAIEGSSTSPPTDPGIIASPFPFVAGQAMFLAIAITRADGRLTTRSRYRVIAGA
jgi:hypothetical protein